MAIKAFYSIRQVLCDSTYVSKGFCEEINVEAVLQHKKLKSAQCHFPYEASTEPLSENGDVQILNSVSLVNAATSAVQERFSTLNNVKEKFGVPANLENLPDKELQKECKTWQITLHFKGH